MQAFRNSFRELVRYPSAIIGLVVIFMLVATAGYAITALPYDRAVTLWRGSEADWYQNPKFAAPVWYNTFSNTKLPVSFIVDSENGGLDKVVDAGAQDSGTITMDHSFDFSYDAAPQELLLYYKNTFASKQPFVSVALTTPDGRKIRIFDGGVPATSTLRFSQDAKLAKRLKAETPEKVMQALFTDPATGNILKGTYRLDVQATTFEKGADLDAQFVMHGHVAGWAGTDQMRRDLMIPLLWGAPIALAFGLLASLGTSILTMVIAAVGTWYSGWVDELIQRITEINLVLPFLSILVMVGTFYSRSIWTILGATIALSIFTGGIKGYRAVFMQVKESGYIEAARAYGASNTRIIFRYLMPRMIPLLIPGLVASVPSFVFLEATLAVLGLGDPVLPTWGKMVEDAFFNGALYKGYFYWILEPSVLLMFTGLGFAMLGFALDRVFNPRLREV